MTTTDQDRQEAQDLLVHIEELLAKADDPATVAQVAKRLRALVRCIEQAEEDEETTEQRWDRLPRLTERSLERKLVTLFDNLFSRRSGGWAVDFEDACVLGGNRGVVISVGNGQEFQLTIIESKRR